MHVRWDYYLPTVGLDAEVSTILARRRPDVSPLARSVPSSTAVRARPAGDGWSAGHVPRSSQGERRKRSGART